jgi:hypothetical protein
VVNASFITDFLRKLDFEPDKVVELLAPEFTFCVLYSIDGEAHEFAGGLAEYSGYLDQREPDGQAHHVELSTRTGQTEVVLGHTTRYGERLGTFTMAAQVDSQEHAVRIYASRTTSLAFELNDP